MKVPASEERKLKAAIRALQVRAEGLSKVHGTGTLRNELTAIRDLALTTGDALNRAEEAAMRERREATWRLA